MCSATPGYIVPRIQSLALNEAARLVADGVATAEEVDLAVKMVLALALPFWVCWSSLIGVAATFSTTPRGTLLIIWEIATPHRRSKSENMRTGKNGLREGEGFFDYRDTDISSYRKERLMEFVAILRHRSLLPTHRH